jgi:hypothetical protein
MSTVAETQPATSKQASSPLPTVLPTPASSEAPVTHTLTTATHTLTSTTVPAVTHTLTTATHTLTSTTVPAVGQATAGVTRVLENVPGASALGAADATGNTSPRQGATSALLGAVAGLGSSDGLVAHPTEALTGAPVAGSGGDGTGGPDAVSPSTLLAPRGGRGASTAPSTSEAPPAASAADTHDDDPRAAASVFAAAPSSASAQTAAPTAQSGSVVAAADGVGAAKAAPTPLAAPGHAVTTLGHTATFGQTPLPLGEHTPVGVNTGTRDTGTAPSAPPAPTPSPTGGFGTGATGGASGGFGLSLILFLLGLSLLGSPGAIRRLMLASERWRPALFVLVPERPG